MADLADDAGLNDIGTSNSPGGSGFTMPSSSSVSNAVGSFGLVGAIAGAFVSYDSAKASAAASQKMAGLESMVDLQRNQAMQISAQRQQMEILRTNQRARSMALTNATSQGAQLGSGLSGGYGQIAGQSGNNLLGVDQNLTIGNNIFGLNTQISQQKELLAKAQGMNATGVGLTSLASSIGKAAGPLGSMVGS
jgi:hypothetical protein